MSYFDHFADSPGTSIGSWINKKSKKCIYSIIKSTLNNPFPTILEIGAGFGELAEIFIGEGFTSYVVVEPNSSMRHLLQNKNIVAKEYLIPHLNENNDSYDLIILVDVFEHLNDTKEAVFFINEAKRVLRQKGLLCIQSPDYIHWKEDFFNGDYSHSNITSVRRTMQLFHNNGFRTIKYVYFSGFITGWLATLLSNTTRLLFPFINGNDIDNKIYKLKLTFLRQFLIIGEKIDS